MPTTTAANSAGIEGAVTAELNSPSPVETRANATPKVADAWAMLPRANRFVWFRSVSVSANPWATSHADTRS